MKSFKKKKKYYLYYIDWDFGYIYATKKWIEEYEKRNNK